jgi:glycosyltransferase involved in cell wall biosynthesis
MLLGASRPGLTRALVEHGFDLVVLDSSRTALRRARDELGEDSEVLLLAADPRELEIPEGVDAMLVPSAVWRAVLLTEDRRHVLRGMLRELRPWGRLLLELERLPTDPDPGTAVAGPEGATWLASEIDGTVAVGSGEEHVVFATFSPEEALAEAHARRLGGAAVSGGPGLSGTRPVVGVIYAEVTSPVVESQTFPLLAALRSAGRQVDAVVFASPRRLFQPREWAAHRRALAALEEAIGRAPLVVSHRPRELQLGKTGKRLARSLRARGIDDAVLICRQPRAALVAAAAREALRDGDAPFVVHDMRGVRPEEYLVSLGRAETELDDEQERMLVIYRDQERQACRRADAVLCVSRAMAQRVRNLHEVPESRVLRLPNHAQSVDDAEELRTRWRRKLRVGDDDLLLAYSGTLAAWQLPEATVLLAAAVRRQEPTTRLLMLTPDTARAQEAIRSAALDGAIVKRASPERAHELVAAADYGMLLRDASAVNRVACPVKFGEYLACGVRPVLTGGIGDQSELCAQGDLGILVGLADAGDAARRLLMDARRPGALGPEARAKRRAWVAETITPLRAAERLQALLDPLC